VKVDTFDFEVETKFFGLVRRARKVCADTETVVWFGKWRFREAQVLEDIMERSFSELLALLASSNKRNLTEE
jgi:hypothetical protein